MKFKLQANDLNEALNVVSIVPPRPVTPQGGAGYLFVVKEGACHIYSRDALHQARVPVEVYDVEGEGSFIYPSDKISSLKYIDGWIEFEAGHDEAEDRYWVNYTSEGGAHAERSTFDPRLMQALDAALDNASEEFDFPAAVLREGFNVIRGFLAKPNDNRVEDHFKTLQLFDKSKKEWEKGNGHLFGADGIRCCYVYCAAFEDRGLSVHGQHLPFLLSFLSKCEGMIQVKMGDGITFAVNSGGQVLGWAHHVKQHGKFNYYPYKADMFVLKTPKDILVKTLRHVRSELDGKKNKVRVTYDHEAKTLRFQTSETSGRVDTVPVGVIPLDLGEKGGGGLGEKEDFGFNVNIDHLLELVEPMRSHEVSLRVAPYEDGKKKAALFRTIEDFHLSEAGKEVIPDDENAGKAYPCRVTRFMPSKD